jgi:hypothetical protein
VYMFLVVDPATTAGAGVPSSDGFNVKSTRSGSGTWHLYAVDDLADSYGIRSFNIKLDPGEGGAISGVSNRSPSTSWDDNLTFGSGTGPFCTGFNDIRSSANITSISGGQGLLNTAQIGGLGISASNFQLKTSGQSFAATSSGQWGNYADPFTSGSLGSTGDTRNALFLAEGTYTGAVPTIDLTTPLSAGGTGVNYWTDAGLTRSTVAPLLSSSNPFACTDCANGNDPFLVKSKITAVPAPQPGPAVLPNPPKPPVVDPAPMAGGPFEPPVVSSNPEIPPVPADDYQSEIQPHDGLYQSQIQTYYFNGDLLSVSVDEDATGVRQDELISYGYTYQPIDQIQEKTLPILSHGGLRYAMTTALAGLQAAETFVDVVPNSLYTSLHASGAELTDRASFESAVAAPEPATLALIGLVMLGALGVVRRHRA